MDLGVGFERFGEVSSARRTTSSVGRREESLLGIDEQSLGDSPASVVEELVVVDSFGGGGSGSSGEGGGVVWESGERRSEGEGVKTFVWVQFPAGSACGGEFGFGIFEERFGGGGEEDDGFGFGCWCVDGKGVGGGGGGRFNDDEGSRRRRRSRLGVEVKGFLDLVGENGVLVVFGIFFRNDGFGGCC